MSLQIPVSLSLSCTGWTDQRSDRIPKILIIKILIIKLINIIILMPDTPRSLTTKWMYHVIQTNKRDTVLSLRYLYTRYVLTPISVQSHWKNKQNRTIYILFFWMSFVVVSSSNSSCNIPAAISCIEWTDRFTLSIFQIHRKIPFLLFLFLAKSLKSLHSNSSSNPLRRSLYHSITTTTKSMKINQSVNLQYFPSTLAKSANFHSTFADSAYF